MLFFASPKQSLDLCELDASNLLKVALEQISVEAADRLDIALLDFLCITLLHLSFAILVHVWGQLAFRHVDLEKSQVF